MRCCWHQKTLDPAPHTQKSLLAPQVTWTIGEPDAVVLGRLRNASVVQGLAEERVRVVLQVRHSWVLWIQTLKLTP